MTARESMASRRAELDGALDLGGHGVAAFGALGGGFRDGFEDAAEGGSVGDAHVVLRRGGMARAGSRRTARVRSAADSAVAMGSKVRPVSEGKDSRVRCEARWARRKNLEERLGQGEGLGRESFEDGGEGFLLLGGRDDLGVGLAVAAEVVAVVEAADFLDGGFGLVAVEEVERDERVFELGHRSAGGDGVLAEALEGGGADGQDAVEFVGGIGAVVPEVRVGMRAAEGAGVFVGDVDEAGLLRLAVENGVEGGGVFAWVSCSSRTHDSRSRWRPCPRCRCWRRSFGRGWGRRSCRG